MKYLYIDDENDTSVESVRDGFNDQELINVIVQQPKDFKTQKNELTKILPEFDGLILDLRLDQNMTLDVSYNAPSIAQELRTVMSDPTSGVKACPIILCSTDERMRATYDADVTSHNLFDYKFLKGSDPNWPKFSQKLHSLATGYKWLNEGGRTIQEIFGRDEFKAVDPRIFERFAIGKTTVYEYAHFIEKEMFNHPGALIKERVLASRLGVNIEDSGDAWVNLRDGVFSETLYKGLFSTGWTRWWADKVVDLFKQISNGKRLAALTGPERLAIIENMTGIQGLVPALPIADCQSLNFWTICEGNKMPLDPLEGFRVYESKEVKPWQEPKYISLNSILSREYESKGLRPHPSENERIQLIKESLTK
ncbi:hypothetical protein [Chitinophaga sp. Ak27]|uniref:hypothetical protein n=1 Tax=Chitinophaga sp. Ak27 TaxID=2726116 RepID=UPI00145F0C76|nr:hypothetical protein [Chitinophaga sp. Ak27]NLU96289.1 hypothetical protein [Chitinophaga sp. Ak27]